jgi:hypothetical protein
MTCKNTFDQDNVTFDSTYVIFEAGLTTPFSGEVPATEDSTSWAFETSAGWFNVNKEDLHIRTGVQFDLEIDTEIN